MKNQEIEDLHNQLIRVCQTPSEMLSLFECETEEDFKKFIADKVSQSQNLGKVDMSKGDVEEQIKECFSNYERPIDMHWHNYPPTEVTIITEKEQENLSREHLDKNNKK